MGFANSNGYGERGPIYVVVGYHSCLSSLNLEKGGQNHGTIYY